MFRVIFVMFPITVVCRIFFSFLSFLSPLLQYPQPHRKSFSGEGETDRFILTIPKSSINTVSPFLI